MKIPKKLKIGGYLFHVKFPYYFKTSSLYGHFDADACEIRLAAVDTNGNRRSDSAIEQTFWHEVLHAINYIYNAGKLDEDTIERLSQGIFQVLKDNSIS